ncbi:MAG: LTA synthase family protein [Eubacterium sp.]|nr:LTA synthase family protein [Eubacterium sp.]
MRIFTGTGLFFGLFYLLGFSFVSGLLTAVLTTVFSETVNRVLAGSIAGVLLFYFSLEYLVYDAFGKYMTPRNIFLGAGDVTGNYGGTVLTALLRGILKILVFALPLIWYKWRGEKILPELRTSPGAALVFAAFAMILLGVFSLAASTGKSKNEYVTRYEFSRAASSFGLLTGTRLELKYSLFGQDKNASFTSESYNENTEEETLSAQSEENNPESGSLTDETFAAENALDIDFSEIAAASEDETVKKISSYAASLTPSRQNEYTGLFAGKNLILICAEAFSGAVVNEELTPALYRLIHNGFYFSDYYQPAWGGSTSTGEYSFLTGLAPQDEVETILETEGKNNYFTMGSQLQRLGYYSCAFHNGSYDYYDRNLTHKNLGYDDWIATDGGLNEISGAWPEDDVFFDTTMETYLGKQPFSIYYMTLSGHAPYEDDHERTQKYLDRVIEVVGEDTYEQTTLNYFCYQMALEDALAIMLDKLEAAGIADDTVICMTTDHYPYGLSESENWGNDEDYLQDLYGHDDVLPWDRDENALVIWSGCLETTDRDKACEISTPVSSLDILPTLSNLFGVEYDSRLLAGRDVFSEQEPLVFWNDYSWKTAEGTYYAEQERFIPAEGSDADDAYVQYINGIVSDKILLSDGILKTDYYEIVSEYLSHNSSSIRG